MLLGHCFVQSAIIYWEASTRHACAYQAREALAETGGPVLSLIAVKKE